MWAGWVYVALLVLYLIARQVIGDRYWVLALIHIFGAYLFLPVLVGLPIALLVRARRLALAASGLVLVAAFWYGYAYLPKPREAAISPFRVVTFNVWAMNPDTKPFERWLTQQTPDVVFIQETPQQYAGHEITQLKALYPFQTSPSSFRWSNLILSKWPIIAADWFGTDEVFTHQRVVIVRNGQQIALYNIHLPNPVVGAPRLRSRYRLLNNFTKYNEKARDEQMRILFEALTREPLPYLIAGDFNTSDQSPVYGDLAAHLGTDTYREVGWGLGATWPYAPLADLPSFVPPLIRIDYVWHSWRFRAVEAVLGPPLGSDHLPILATFDVLPGGDGK